jgi:hypothetical protein
MGERKSKTRPAASGRARLGPALVFLLTLAAAAGAVWGVKRLGDVTRREVADRGRYTVRISDIECGAPPGLDRASFLAEVRYQSKSPQTFQSIDPDAKPELSAAFAEHPWVAAVEGVSVEPKGTVRVRLRFRVPALAVTVESGEEKTRVVDTAGVLLPISAGGESLPRLVTPVPAPTVASGQPWPDETVRRAVELVAAHRPRTLEKTPQGWRLTTNDGKTVLVEK